MSYKVAQTTASHEQSVVQREQPEFQKAPGEFEAEAARDAFLKVLPMRPEAIAARLSNVGAAARERIIRRLQQERGNAFVQRVVEAARGAPGRLVGLSQPQMVDEVQRRKGSGAPLPESSQDQMEGFFGAHLGNVRVHNDSEAQSLNRELDAQAFTVGNDMFFAEGKYDPSSREGQGLLAHELTHVGQQGGFENPAAQRTAGERAAQIVQRETVLVDTGVSGDSAGDPGARNSDRALVVQREPIFISSAARGGGGVGAPGTVQPLTPDQLQKLNVEIGAELRREAGNAITRAVEQFHRACDTVKKELDAVAAQKAALISLAIDIIGGFAAPGLAAPIGAEIATRQTLRTSFASPGGSSLIHGLAADTQRALEKLDTLAELRDLGATLNPAFWERLNGDQLKATFTGAFKGASLAAKSMPPSQSTQEKKDTVTDLSYASTLMAQDMDRSLPAKSESELMAIIMGLDASKANEGAYAAQVRRYLQEVLTIGRGPMTESGVSVVKLVKMNAYGGMRLALVDTGTDIILGLIATQRNLFKSWVAPDMVESAVARAGCSTSKDVPELNPEKISGHIPAPPPGYNRFVD
jgi:hypothetical protein